MPKTFNDSYIYNLRIEQNNKGVMGQILYSNRVDKYSDSFKEVADTIKSRAPYGFFYKLLMDPKVVLIYPHKPAPMAFKVIYSKDLKDNNISKIFMDITDCIDYKDGYYKIRDINIMNAYIASACNTLLYARFNDRFSSNVNILQSSTRAFVSLFSHVLDYLRIPEYRANKMKVDYLIGLYFIHNVMDRDATTRSAKTLASKISGIGERQLLVADYLYDIEDFDNIDTFIRCLDRNFKLGTTGTILDKWLSLYGSGTQYAMEYYPALATMITNRYCNTYLNRAMIIEKCVGRKEVQDLSNEIFTTIKNSLK